MSDFRADLHCHSTYSDGSLQPKELVALAKGLGLQGLSITDHDATGGFREAEAAGMQMGLRVIPGIELTANEKDHTLHILAYSFIPEHPKMVAFCERHILSRNARNRAMLKKLEEAGMPLSEDEVISLMPLKHTIGRPHIALGMIKKGYVETVQQAFQLYLAEGKSCYVSGDPFTIEETIDLIHEVGGVAVIAHPHLIKYETLLKKLLKMPFDGIEAHYSQFPAHRHEEWIKIAEAKQWFITGGSDFHGAIKPQTPLGCSWTRKESFEYLYERYLLNQKNF